MPCNGVAVAIGQIESNLAELLAQIPATNLQNAIITLLKTKYPQLRRNKVQPLPAKYDAGTVQSGDTAFKLGPYLAHIKLTGEIIVSCSHQTRKQQTKALTQNIKADITDLVTRLTGHIQQQQIINQIRTAGYIITNQQTAPNGAIVLEVQL